MHPSASGAVCVGKVVDSHTIQRKGSLQKITDASNHVCHLAPAAGHGYVVDEIGWKKASTFPGYCARHDSEVFDALERMPFSGTHEQCVLQAYRNVCNELYKKRALLESLQYQRDVLDRGCDVERQIELQLTFTQNIAGQTKSKDELERLWRRFEGVVAQREYDRLSSKCYFFKGDLCVTSAGAIHAEFDFRGNRLTDMWDLNADAQMLSHSTMATDEGGAIVFAWFTDEKLPSAIVDSFSELPDEDKGDIFVQYCFLNSENTYFSKGWWNSLGLSRQERLKRFAAALFYDGGRFVASANRLVDWNFDNLNASKHA
jgi:hypothetical protein